MDQELPRLLIVSQGIDGGIAPLVHALAAGLQPNGWRCFIAYVGRPAPTVLPEKDKAKGIGGCVITTGRARSIAEITGLLKSIWILARHVRREKPRAIILAGFIPALLYALPFKLLSSTRIVFWNHGPQNTFLRIKKLLFPLVRNGIDDIVCISKSTAESLSKHFGISSDALFIIPNGIAPERWQAVPPPPGFAKLRVLMPLRCDLNQKDPMTLIKAAAQLRRRGVDIELTLVGTGVHEALIREAIDAEGQGAALQLLPPPTSLPSFMADYNVVCLSTKFEGLPTVVIEGMLARRAVVASRVAGCVDVIRHNENGFLFEPGSADDCAAKLDALRSHPDLPNILQQAFDEALARYTPSSMVGQFASLLDSEQDITGT